jgi:hypothetical protein
MTALQSPPWEMRFSFSQALGRFHFVIVIFYVIFIIFILLRFTFILNVYNFDPNACYAKSYIYSVRAPSEYRYQTTVCPNLLAGTCLVAPQARVRHTISVPFFCLYILFNVYLNVLLVCNCNYEILTLQ